MNERSWERLGASTAIAWVVLVLGNFIVVPKPPGINDSTSIITAYFGDNYSRMQRAIGFMSALFPGTVGIAMIRGLLARPWLGWFGMLAALLTLAAGIAEFYAASAPDFRWVLAS